MWNDSSEIPQDGSRIVFFGNHESDIPEVAFYRGGCFYRPKSKEPEKPAASWWWRTVYCWAYAPRKGPWVPDDGAEWAEHQPLEAMPVAANEFVLVVYRDDRTARTHSGVAAPAGALPWNNVVAWRRP